MNIISSIKKQTINRGTLLIGLLMLFFAGPIQAKEYGPYHGVFNSETVYGVAAQFDEGDITKGDATWSMNFWVKPSKPILSKNLILAGFGDGGKLKSMRYWVIANDELEFWDGTKDSIKTGLKLESHQWQMLTAIHANGVLKLYRNGTEVASRSVVFNNAKNRIKIAPRPQKNEGKFSGNVANFKIWDNALTIAHIQSLFKTAENLDALPFSKGAPETWNSDGTSNRNETELQNPETLPKSISGPQKPSLADVPTAKHLLLNKERGGVLAGPWKLIEANKIKLEGAQLSMPEVSTAEWLPATVPGTVLTTMVNQGIYPHPYIGLNNLAIPEILNRQDYWYRLEFDVPNESAGLLSSILFNGINYKAEAWLNGKRLGEIKGAFIRGNFDTSGVLKSGQKNVLAVKISPPPNPGIPHEQSIAAGHGLNGGNLCLDGPTFFCSQGWDWIPSIRDRNTGIWQNVELVLTGAVTVGDTQVITRIPAPIGSRAVVTIRADVTNQSRSKQVGIVSASFEGVTVEKKVELSANEAKTVEFSIKDFPQLSVVSPRLWWPNGYGKPELYQLTTTFTDRDGRVSSAKKEAFGMRETSVVLTAMDSKLNLERYEFHPTEAGAEQVINKDHASLVNSTQGWVPTIANSANPLPGLKVSKSTDTEPYLEIRVNGQRIAIRGGNWGMDDAMKNISRDRLEPYIRLQRDAHFNTIRNWCGQSMSKDFFDLCDEYGILVLNEFWLTTQNYNAEPLDNALFLANAQDAIKRYRNHPSIVIWLGRNEGVPPPFLNEGLDELVRKWDGTRYYQPNSRHINLSGSGPWNYIDPKEYFTSKNHKGFKSELGLPSPLTADSIRSMIPSEDLWPQNDVWAYHDWVPSGPMDTKTYSSALETQLGAPTDFEDFVRKSQMINYDAHRAMYEGMNSALWSPTTGLLIWMSHPSWPSMIWQIYGSDYQPNASYYGIKKACEPIHIQLDLPDNQVVATNTTVNAISGAKIIARVYDLESKLLFEKKEDIDLPINGVVKVFTLSSTPKTGVYFVRMELRDSKGYLLSENLYWKADNPTDLNQLNQLPKVDVEVKAKSLRTERTTVVTLELKNSSKTAALMTFITLRNSLDGQRVLPAYADENYVSMLPGESKTVTIESPLKVSTGALSVTIEGWNIQPQTILIP